MRKVNEKNYNGVMVKYYDVESNSIDPIGFIEHLIQSGVQVQSIYVEEDVEFDMKMNTGHYTLEQLKAKYPQIKNMDYSTLFRVSGVLNDCPIKVEFKNDSAIIYMTTASPGLELPEILEKKTENLTSTLTI